MFTRFTKPEAVAASAVLMVGLIVGLVACAPVTVTPVTQEGALGQETVDPALATFYDQKLVWKDCTTGMQCTTAIAPIDWNEPSGATLNLSMIRHKATKGPALGSLFVNPGGPGASGVEFISASLDYAVGKPLQEKYDVIGFDPRGVGQSTPVTCFTDAKKTDDLLYGITPGVRASADWLASREASSAEFAAACAQNTGSLLAHVDTVSAAKDLDMLRYTVGDARFNFLGYSYGTLLGTTYAELFPTKVGRMVLDGALDPASSSSDVSRTQAVGFENALRAYLAWCITQSNCPVAGTGTVDSAMTEISQILSRLDANPLPASGTEARVLGADTLVTAIIAPLYDKNSWANLSSVFASTLAGDPTSAFGAADWYNGRDSAGAYKDNSTEAFLSINCLDYPAKNDLASWQADAQTIIAAAPVIGPYMVYGDTLCANWPYQSSRVLGPIAAVGSPDILVIGTTNDPATPYQWAVNLAGELTKGHLISYAGEGHTAYNKSNSCVDDAVTNFFLAGTVPASDPKC